MIELTRSLSHWLWENHRDKLVLIKFGHIELFTDDMQREYIKWCNTEEGKKWLQGRENYNE